VAVWDFTSFSFVYKKRKDMEAFIWIALIGGPGTAKHAVKDAMVAADGFVPMEPQNTVPLHPDGMSLQVQMMVSRWRMQREIQKRTADEDLVTVRTLWDTHAVYSGLMLRHNEITDREFCQLRNIDAALTETVEPPTVIIHLKATRISQAQRLGLRQRTQLSDEYLTDLARLYNDFADRIRIPVVEIDAGRPFEEVLTDVRGEIMAVRASRQTGGPTIWQKSFWSGGAAGA